MGCRLWGCTESDMTEATYLVKEPLEGDNQVMHGTRFFLVNPEGEVIKGYDGISSSEIDIIVGDLRAVTKE